MLDSGEGVLKCHGLCLHLVGGHLHRLDFGFFVADELLQVLDLLGITLFLFFSEQYLLLKLTFEVALPPLIEINLSEIDPTHFL